MDADLVKSVIGLVVAIIPLIIVILSLVRSRGERKTQPNDPLLIAKLIKRYPVDQKLWNKIRLRKTIIDNTLLFSYYFLFGLVFTYVDKLRLNSNLYNAGLIVMVISILFISLKISVSSKNMFVDARNARYFCFTKVDIIIESNYHYLFNKCQEALKNLKFYLVEVNESEGTIEACQLSVLSSGRMSVLLIKLESIINAYAVILRYEPISRRYFYSSALEHCNYINRFIKNLLSKPKNSEDMGKGDPKILDDVGD